MLQVSGKQVLYDKLSIEGMYRKGAGVLPGVLWVDRLLCHLVEGKEPQEGTRKAVNSLKPLVVSGLYLPSVTRYLAYHGDIPDHETHRGQNCCYLFGCSSLPDCETPEFSSCVSFTSGSSEPEHGARHPQVAGRCLLAKCIDFDHILSGFCIEDADLAL